MYLTVSPAYGRDYRSAAAAKLDWEGNKDFRIETYGVGGTYVNRQDLEESKAYSHICIRYAKMTRVTIVPLNTEEMT